MSDKEKQQISDLVRRRVIRCRTNESEFDAAARAATKANLSLSEWLRLIVRQNS